MIKGLLPNMKIRIIDLSVPMEDCAGEPTPVKIKYITHERGATLLGLGIPLAKRKSPLKFLKEIILYLSGVNRIGKADFPNGQAISNEKITVSTHSGTHLDAPWHFGPLCEGRNATKVEDIPLEWCYNDGVVLNLRHKKAGESISLHDIKKSLSIINYKLNSYDIVLISTGVDKYWGQEDYFFKYPGMSQEATAWLVEQGIKIIGIDSFGFDRPFSYMVQDYLRTKDKKYLWPAHMYGRIKEYCHIERMANLDQIPKPYGFKVACFPVKIRNVGASWVRAVAIIEE